MDKKRTDKTRQIWICFFQAAALAALLLSVWLLTKENEYNEIDVEAVAQELVACMPDTVVPENDMVLKERFGLEANVFDAAVYYGPDSNMDAAELLLIDMKDRSQTEQIKAAIQQRIEYQKSCFEGYGVDQMELINHAKTVIYGDYVLFIVSKDSKPARDMFAGAVIR